MDLNCLEYWNTHFGNRCQRIRHGLKSSQLYGPNHRTRFLLSGIVALRQLGVQSFADFWAIWGEGSEPFPGQIKYGFWHVAIWSWFANAAMHIGMSDLSVFRFARKASTGWTSAAGMYIGHFMAWIAAALLYAVYIKSSEAQQFLLQGEAPPVAPGPLAYNALGVFGFSGYHGGLDYSKPHYLQSWIGIPSHL